MVSFNNISEFIYEEGTVTAHLKLDLILYKQGWHENKSLNTCL